MVKDSCIDNEFKNVLPDVPIIMGSVVHVHDGKTVNIHPIIISEILNKFFLIDIF